MSQRLLLVDSASQYYRAFFGVPDSVRAPDGRQVNAVRGFFASLTRLLAETGATRLVLAWDEDWRPKFRTDLLPSYKAHRVAADGSEDSPAALLPQVDLIVELAAALGLARVGVAGFEADDIISTIAYHDVGPVSVVTGDRDLFQVVDDARDVAIWYTGKGTAELVRDTDIVARYGVCAAQYADFAVLRGDPSDGLPGVRGIGEKGAAKLLIEYGSLDQLLRAVADDSTGLKPATRRALGDGHDYLALAGPVVRVRTNVPLPAYDDLLRSQACDPVELARLIALTGLQHTFERWLAAVNQATAE
jgi:5'-3' exonuclease